MAGIFQKARVFFLANIHTLLDKGINLDSIAAIKVYIRDLEQARADLQGQLAEQSYDLKTKETNLTAHRAREQQLCQTVSRLGAGNETARAIASDVVKLRQQIATEMEAVAADTKTVEALRASVAKVVQREADMKSRVSTLEAQDATARAKEKAAAAINAVGDASDATEAVDGMAQKIGHRDARASAALDQSVSSLSTTGQDAAHEMATDDLLRELTAGSENSQKTAAA